MVCPGVKPRRLLPDQHALARQWFHPPGQWLQQASFHFPASSFLQLSISLQITCPWLINLQAFQQSLYNHSLEGRVFTQAQLLHISSSSLQSNDSTPTSADPEWEDIFPLILFLTWLGLSSVWVHRVSLACHPAAKCFESHSTSHLTVLLVRSSPTQFLIRLLMSCCLLSRTNNHYLFLVPVPSICHHSGHQREATISYSGPYFQCYKLMQRPARAQNLQSTTKRRYMSKRCWLD